MLPTSALDYELPPELIATHPASPRETARLLVVDRRHPDRLADRTIADLPGLLRPGDLLVFNTTRVLPARFHGERVGTGGRMEGLYLHDALESGEAGELGERGLAWVALIRGRHTRPGAVFELFDAARNPGGVRLTVTGRPADEPGAWTARVSGAAGRSSAEILERLGTTPLPPYILKARREAGGAGGGRGGEPEDDARDRAEYQTVFAREAGSVAAPTAGLHFTPDLLRRLAERGVGRAEVVLHVGAGTFRPVETEYVEQHPMHAEWCSMAASALEAVARTRRQGGRVIAVGTTAARTLESYAAALGGTEAGGEPPASIQTRLLVTPGYRFRAVDGLLTNFHLPRSTLLALVAALLEGEGVEGGGEGGGVAAVRGVYAYAVRERYRFYSFGDACLIV